MLWLWAILWGRRCVIGVIESCGWGIGVDKDGARWRRSEMDKRRGSCCCEKILIKSAYICNHLTYADSASEGRNCRDGILFDCRWDGGMWPLFGLPPWKPFLTIHVGQKQVSIMVDPMGNEAELDITKLANTVHWGCVEEGLGWGERRWFVGQNRVWKNIPIIMSKVGRDMSPFARPGLFLSNIDVNDKDFSGIGVEMGNYWGRLAECGWWDLFLH